LALSIDENNINMINLNTFGPCKPDLSPSLIRHNLFAVSSKVQTNYAEVEYQEGDSFLFGPETRGLPQAILDRFKGITLPMQAGSHTHIST
jgi:tRNA (cytidine/uridine-2'-O-)-methyltransferase